MAEIRNISPSEFSDVIASGTVLIDFWAPWCSYCKVLGLVLEQTKAALPAELVIGKINVDEASELAAEYDISTLPTLVLFKDGKACGHYVNPSKAEILKILS